MPSNITVSGQIQLVNEAAQGRPSGLYPVLDRYDYILIDCQPSLGLLTVNALACSQIIHLLALSSACAGWHCLPDTRGQGAGTCQPYACRSAEFLGLADTRTVNAREVMARVLERFWRPGVRHRFITRTVRFLNCVRSVTTWAPKSGGRLPCAGLRGHRPMPASDHRNQRAWPGTDPSFTPRRASGSY